MTPAGKLSREPGANDGIGHLIRDEARGNNKYIGIIVGLDKTADFRGPGKPGANAGVLVESHHHAVAGPTNRYATIHLPTLDSTRERMGKIGIVAAFRTVRTEIDNLIAFAQKVS